MALFDTTRPVVDGRNTMRAGGLFGQFVGIFAAWNDTRVTKTALTKLSDHELQDVGMNRGDIDPMSRKSRY